MAAACSAASTCSWSALGRQTVAPAAAASCAPTLHCFLHQQDSKLSLLLLLLLLCACCCPCLAVCRSSANVCATCSSPLSGNSGSSLWHSGPQSVDARKSDNSCCTAWWQEERRSWSRRRSSCACRQDCQQPQKVAVTLCVCKDCSAADVWLPKTCCAVPCWCDMHVCLKHLLCNKSTATQTTHLGHSISVQTQPLARLAAAQQRVTLPEARAGARQLVHGCHHVQLSAAQQGQQQRHNPDAVLSGFRAAPGVMDGSCVLL